MISRFNLSHLRIIWIFIHHYKIMKLQIRVSNLFEALNVVTWKLTAIWEPLMHYQSLLFIWKVGYSLFRTMKYWDQWLLSPTLDFGGIYVPLFQMLTWVWRRPRRGPNLAHSLFHREGGDHGSTLIHSNDICMEKYFKNEKFWPKKEKIII